MGVEPMPVTDAVVITLRALLTSAQQEIEVLRPPARHYNRLLCACQAAYAELPTGHALGLVTDALHAIEGDAQDV